MGLQPATFNRKRDRPSYLATPPRPADPTLPSTEDETQPEAGPSRPTMANVQHVLLITAHIPANPADAAVAASSLCRRSSHRPHPSPAPAQHLHLVNLDASATSKDVAAHIRRALPAGTAITAHPLPESSSPVHLSQASEATALAKALYRALHRPLLPSSSTLASLVDRVGIVVAAPSDLHPQSRSGDDLISALTEVIATALIARLALLSPSSHRRFYSSSVLNIESARGNSNSASSESSSSGSSSSSHYGARKSRMRMNVFVSFKEADGKRGPEEDEKVLDVAKTVCRTFQRSASEYTNATGGGLSTLFEQVIGLYSDPGHGDASDAYLRVEQGEQENTGRGVRRRSSPVTLLTRTTDGWQRDGAPRLPPMTFEPSVPTSSFGGLFPSSQPPFIAMAAAVDPFHRPGAPRGMLTPPTSPPRKDVLPLPGALSKTATIVSPPPVPGFPPRRASEGDLLRPDAVVDDGVEYYRVGRFNEPQKPTVMVSGAGEETIIGKLECGVDVRVVRLRPESSQTFSTPPSTTWAAGLLTPPTSPDLRGHRRLHSAPVNTTQPPPRPPRNPRRAMRPKLTLVIPDSPLAPRPRPVVPPASLQPVPLAPPPPAAIAPLRPNRQEHMQTVYRREAYGHPVPAPIKAVPTRQKSVIPELANPVVTEVEEDDDRSIYSVASAARTARAPSRKSTAGSLGSSLLSRSTSTSTTTTLGAEGAAARRIEVEELKRLLMQRSARTKAALGIEAVSQSQRVELFAC